MVYYGFGERKVKPSGKYRAVRSTGHPSLVLVCTSNVTVIYIICSEAPFLQGTLSVYYTMNA
jgi:hypothetical protein